MNVVFSILQTVIPSCTRKNVREGEFIFGNHFYRPGP